MPTGNQPHESTLADVFALLQKCASKDDIKDIKTKITDYKRETDEKFGELKQQVDIAMTTSNSNAEKIDELQASIETLKQEQLKNNICISGVPVDITKNNNTAEIIIAIADKLDVKLVKNNFSSYAISENKFIIVRFHNYKHKHQLLLRIRTKKSLMVEEVFKTKSNSQLYLNDHLTPYFNHLFLLARNAKKNGTIATASSYGGKIRIRKNINDAPHTITCERQLISLIGLESANNTIDYVQCVDNTDDSSINTSHENSSSPNAHAHTRNDKTGRKKTTTTTKSNKHGEPNSLEPKKKEKPKNHERFTAGKRRANNQLNAEQKKNKNN